MKVAYVSDARIPTEKAHGVQIMRMCEAFTSLGAETTLFHPRRHQVDPALRNADPFALYGVSHRFTIKTLSNIDIYRIHGVVPRTVFRPISVVHGAVWERYLARSARKTGADLYFSRDSTPIAAMSLATSGCPTVVEFHEEHRGISYRSLHKALHAPGFLFAVAVTSSLAEEVAREYDIPPEKVMTLHDGVDAEKFDVPAPVRTEGDKPVVMYVGSLLPNRGVYTLVKAAALVPEADARIVGGLPEQIEEVKRLAAESNVDNVEFVRQVPHSDVPSQMAQADVLVLPMTGSSGQTMYRASPMKLFEYMATGRAVVASDLPSLREVVKHGESAWLVKPDDPESLAEGIRHVLSDHDLARRLGERARQLAHQYSWKSRAEKILAAAGLLTESKTGTPA